MRGKGKTNYIKIKLLDITPAWIVDIRNEFKHLPTFVSLQHFQYFVLDNKNKNKYIKPPLRKDYYKEGQYRFCFNSTEELQGLFKIMLHFRNCTIVFDEADALFKINTKIQKLMENIFLGSRNNNVSTVFIGKRPSLMPILIRSQADRFVIFCTEEEWDINYLEKRVKQNFPKDIYKLERGEAIVFDSGEKPRVEIYEKFKGE